MSEMVSVSHYTYLLHPCNTALVTCCDSEGRPNIITIAWLMPISVSPPLVGMSVHPSRFSYQLLKATGEFVINVVPYEIARQALYCGRKSGLNVDKFSDTNLTPLPAQQVRPPIIQECLAFLECRLQQDIEAGDHHLIIAEVLAAYAHSHNLAENGLYNLEKAHPLLHMGRNCFSTPQVQVIEPRYE